VGNNYPLGPTQGGEEHTQILQSSPFGSQNQIYSKLKITNDDSQEEEPSQATCQMVIKAQTDHGYEWD